VEARLENDDVATLDDFLMMLNFLVFFHIIYLYLQILILSVLM